MLKKFFWGKPKPQPLVTEPSRSLEPSRILKAKKKTTFDLPKATSNSICLPNKEIDFLKERTSRTPEEIKQGTLRTRNPKKMENYIKFYKTQGSLGCDKDQYPKYKITEEGKGAYCCDPSQATDQDMLDYINHYLQILIDDDEKGYQHQSDFFYGDRYKYIEGLLMSRNKYIEKNKTNPLTDKLQIPRPFTSIKGWFDAKKTSAELDYHIRNRDVMQKEMMDLDWQAKYDATLAYNAAAENFPPYKEWWDEHGEEAMKEATSKFNSYEDWLAVNEVPSLTKALYEAKEDAYYNGVNLNENDLYMMALYEKARIGKANEAYTQAYRLKKLEQEKDNYEEKFEDFLTTGGKRVTRVKRGTSVKRVKRGTSVKRAKRGTRVK